MVVDHPGTHGDFITHQRGTVIQRVDIQRQVVGFKTPAVQQRTGRELNGFAHQHRRVGYACRIQHQITRQQPVHQVSKRPAQRDSHRAVTADGFTRLPGVVLLRGQRQSLQAQQRAALIIERVCMDV